MTLPTAWPDRFLYSRRMIVCWNSLADNDWRFQSEMNRKAVGHCRSFCLYILLLSWSAGTARIGGFPLFKRKPKTKG